MSKIGIGDQFTYEYSTHLAFPKRISGYLEYAFLLFGFEFSLTSNCVQSFFLCDSDTVQNFH